MRILAPLFRLWNAASAEDVAKIKAPLLNTMGLDNRVNPVAAIRGRAEGKSRHYSAISTGATTAFTTIQRRV